MTADRRNALKKAHAKVFGNPVQSASKPVELSKFAGTPFTIRDVVYISGAMTGKIDYNRAAFRRVREMLRLAGVEVICPSESNTPQVEAGIMNYQQAMRACIRMVHDCTAMIMLDGWPESRGARVEALMADVLGLPIYDERFRKIIIINTQIYFETSRL